MGCEPPQARQAAFRNSERLPGMHFLLDREEMTHARSKLREPGSRTLNSPDDSKVGPNEKRSPRL